ncbi:MAG TPA: CmcJ/NvfI family oxidoreductase [Acidimicrobiales bacterium]|nr:CmcJ/NvfI family oxidoreductase [Acidimicrobiales bacterium]
MRKFCRTTLNYLSSVGPDGPADHPTEVDIFDGRAVSLDGWHVCGFELFEHPSSIVDWSDEDALGEVHHGEMEKLARDLTGADIALVSGHIKRSPDDARRHEQLSPIPFVHSDFAAGHIDYIRRAYREPTDAGSRALARNGVDATVIEDANRILVLQFWRNLGPEKMDYPIAFCDARTVSPDEARSFHVTDYAGTGASFDALGIVEPADPAKHAWYAFPELTSREVVAFRTYDTDLVQAGKAFFTPHSAFRDPDVEVGRPARSSIELRATCLFT